MGQGTLTPNGVANLRQNWDLNLDLSLDPLDCFLLFDCIAYHAAYGKSLANQKVILSNFFISIQTNLLSVLGPIPRAPLFEDFLDISFTSTDN